MKLQINMRIRTFHAKDMNIAMQMIRDALGEDAIIISNEIENGEVVVTAASEPIEELQSSKAPPSFTSDEVISNIGNILKFHSTPESVINKLLEIAKYLCLQGKDERIDLTRLMAASFQYSPLPLEQEKYTIMLVGAPGVGKTMTIAKMASQVVMENNKPIVITTDNKRAGGVEQLSAFTTILGLELHVADNRGELWRFLQEFSPHNRILIDTGGVNPYKPKDLQEISEYIKLDQKIEPILVAAAGSDSADADDMARAFAPLGINRLLITRIDAARRYGSILTAAHTGKLAFSNASNSSKIIGEFTTLNPATITELLLSYKH